MENRFGFKDLIVSALLVGVLVMIWLAMNQYDRQWTQLQQISRDMTDQTRILQKLYQGQQQQTGAQSEESLRELKRIRELLEHGVALTPSPSDKPPTTTPEAVAPNHPANTQTADMGPPVGKDIDPFADIRKAQAMPGYTQGDNFVRAFGSVSPKLTPLISSDYYAALVQEYVIEGLIGRDTRTLDWIPNIAEYWQISRDGLRFEFQIRRGVTFSDGEPLTADDVLFTYNWIMNPKVECPREKAYFGRIKSVERMNDYRVAFIFGEPYFQAFETAGGMGILAKHFYSRFTPEQFNHSTGLLFGSGPYRMADPENWRPEPGKAIELERNERYWGPAAPYAKMVFQIIDNESARLTTFRNGKLDVFGALPEQHREMLKDEALTKRTKHFEFETPDEGYMFVAWNQVRNGKPTRFADVRVRRAMTMLTDRQRILDEIFFSYGSVAAGPFSPATKQPDPTIKPLPFDPDKAVALLKEAGYTMSNGSLVGPDGQPFRFKFTYTSSSPTYERVVLFIKDTFARAGIEVVPDPAEWSVMMQRMDQRDFDVISLSWMGSIEDDPYQIFHSSQIPAPGDNFISYHNDRLDHLIDQGRATVDEAKRMEIWHQVHRILADDQPYTFLMRHKSLAWVDGRFQNVHLTTLGLEHNYLEWWVPKGQWRWTKE